MSTITMTAKDLKNRTGDAFRALARGDRVLLTRRGKPVAVMAPFPGEDVDVLPFERAWEEIEAALEASEPAFASSDEAMSVTRKRPAPARP